MKKIPTSFLDKNGQRIYFNGRVRYKGDEYDVVKNDFHKDKILVIDNACGQVHLYKVYRECEVIAQFDH